eukprot:gene8193-16848_t
MIIFTRLRGLFDSNQITVYTLANKAIINKSIKVVDHLGAIKISVISKILQRSSKDNTVVIATNVKVNVPESQYCIFILD